jgi:hypothetical protein
MTEVEDVTGRPGGDGRAAVLDDGAGGTVDHRPAGQQDDRVEVAL